MIAIIDYGAGNLESVKKALDFIGAESVISADKDIIKNADKVILPGVGSFGDAINSMRENDLVETIKEVAFSGKPFLGICLGLQLLFESSEESTGVQGLGIIKGKCVKFPMNMGLKVPEIGWNSIDIKQNNGLYNNIKNDSYAYFVHSYYVVCDDESDVATTTNYGIDFTSSIQRGNICATQFHPEKSSDIGLQILKNFVSMKGK